MITLIVSELTMMRFARINGNPVYDAGGGEIFRVPAPRYMPHHFRKKWCYDPRSGRTLVCLEDGQMFAHSGEPGSRVVQFLNRICPEGTLEAPMYLAGISVQAEVVLNRLTGQPFEDD